MATPDKPQRPKVFFMNPSRRPFFRGKDRQVWEKWQRPSEDVYLNDLEQDGFLTPRLISAQNMTLSETAMQDLGDLEKYLLEPFFRCDQKAKYYQNIYYRYQWILVIVAFVTAFVGTVTLTLGAMADTGNQSVAERVIKPADENSAVIAGFITTIVGAVGSFYTARDRSKYPQRRWFQWRRASEELRHHYFYYLMHLPPYDKADRADVLESKVVEIENSGEIDEPQAQS